MFDSRSERELLKLVKKYDRLYGDGSGLEVALPIAFAFGWSKTLNFFKRANGRKIQIDVHPDTLDSLIVRFVTKQARKSL
jgi:hypothetical protein